MTTGTTPPVPRRRCSWSSNSPELTKLTFTPTSKLSRAASAAGRAKRRTGPTTRNTTLAYACSSPKGTGTPQHSATIGAWRSSRVELTGTCRVRRRVRSSSTFAPRGNSHEAGYPGARHLPFWTPGWPPLAVSMPADTPIVVVLRLRSPCVVGRVAAAAVAGSRVSTACAGTCKVGGAPGSARNAS